MLKQVLFLITAGVLAVLITQPMYAAPFSDVVAPQMSDVAVDGDAVEPTTHIR